ncbi:hypothetical protein O181_091076 [Austropuccinia psidii MF-1]|uniref:Reverse transcriptase/retrotransposon-derived protein RNase H-like domain-containing protein n=1 Tax=Austropuccinia psidii MF-1 TaxID=1389203 RepID=A0A9Q3P9A6_9BASI|nr:hypothetical protein [Austropuccinia psidii MF-1]
MDHQILAAKYKSVLKKVRPVNEPMPQDLNPPLERPPFSRDPYETPLLPNTHIFQETFKSTHERLQAVNFGPPGWLSNEEINSLNNVRTLREKEIAFCEEEKGLLKHSYGKSYKIPVIPHEPWQKKPIPITKPILPQFTELIRERIKTRLYEIVHDLQELNKFTIKDSGLPPHIEEFEGAFAGRECYGIGDIMGGYDERELYITSGTLTTFETPLGRMQLTRIPQGATNSVVVYQAQMTWILQEEIPESVGICIDYGGIKGQRSLYNQETLPETTSIRRFIWECAITLERILFRIEEAGLTISGSNFACCVSAWDIVGNVLSLKGREISKQKINKITNWPTPLNKKEIRGFLGLCGYVRMFIENFSQVESPLSSLTREDVDWDWDQKCEEALHELRRIVGEEITLKKLDYDKGEGKIKLAVDSKALIEMINTLCLLNAPMTRWVAFIQLFSFDLVHKPGKTFTIPDGISRRPKNSEEEEEDAPEFDEEEDWIKQHPGFGAKNVNSLNFPGIQVPTKQEGFWKRMQEHSSKIQKPESSKEE